MKPLRLIIVLSIAVIAGLHCSHPSQPTTGLGNQYSIYLTGRVLDKNGNPMANAVAKLADKNLADTTGADGYYYITEKKANGAAKTATASVGDSLQILKAGQVITYLDIPKWIDTLPDVFLIQRDIYGSLSPAPTSISRITATITGDSIPDSLAQVAVLGYIPATGNYSGFIYFVYTAQTLNYNVYVSVYNADSALIGRSITVTFPSTAGDISIPAFDPNNAAPIVYAGNDTTVSINDTIRLHATASDSFGQHIAKWEWNINNTGFRQTATGDTIIVAPADSDSLYICEVRVTNNSGITAVDTMIVDVVLDPPVAYAGNDTVVAENSPVTIYGSATQEFGTIVKWEWNINNSGFVQTSTGDTTITTPGSIIPTYPCILRATDDDGQTGEDTVNLQVGISAPILVFPINGDLNISITPPQDTLRWNAIVGATGYNLQVSNDSMFSSLITLGRDTIVDTFGVIYQALTNGTYYWRVRARNTGGWGDWSEVWSFTATTTPSTTLISPANGTIIDYDSCAYSVQWNMVPNASSYQFQLDTSLDFSSVIIDYNTGMEPYWHTNCVLVHGTKYYWRVRVQNVYGWSNWSDVWYFIRP